MHFSVLRCVALGLTSMLVRARHLFGRAVRETGQAMDRLGLTLVDKEIFRETCECRAKELCVCPGGRVGVGKG